MTQTLKADQARIRTDDKKPKSAWWPKPLFIASATAATMFATYPIMAENIFAKDNAAYFATQKEAIINRKTNECVDRFKRQEAIFELSEDRERKTTRACRETILAESTISEDEIKEGAPLRVVATQGPVAVLPSAAFFAMSTLVATLAFLSWRLQVRTARNRKEHGEIGSANQI